jgi:hypothetical protein
MPTVLPREDNLDRVCPAHEKGRRMFSIGF